MMAHWRSAFGRCLSIFVTAHRAVSSTTTTIALETLSRISFRLSGPWSQPGSGDSTAFLLPLLWYFLATAGAAADDTAAASAVCSFSSCRCCWYVCLPKTVSFPWSCALYASHTKQMSAKHTNKTRARQKNRCQRNNYVFIFILRHRSTNLQKNLHCARCCSTKRCCVLPPLDILRLKQWTVALQCAAGNLIYLSVVNKP